MPEEKALESWKEIAHYLGRSVRTVIRWEKSEGLPVHRHLHDARSSIFAYPSELDAWRAARQPAAEPVRVRYWRRPAFAAVLALALIQAGSGPTVTRAGAAEVTVRRVWAGPGADTTGAPSPDGRYLSFVDGETGDLAVRDLTTGQNRRLTRKGSWAESHEFAMLSRFSRDGKQVAYTWFGRTSFDLRLIALDGSPSRVLYGNSETPYVWPLDWSPGGRQILCVFSRHGGTYQLALVSVADGAVRVLKSLEWKSPSSASFSPDGRHIVYDLPVHETLPNRDIFLLAADGSREVPLVQHPALDTSPFWFPDGHKVLFSSDRTGSPSLWAISVSGGKPQGSPELVKKTLGRSLPMGFTRDGSLYYGVFAGEQDIYVAAIDPEGGRVAAPAAKAVERYEGSNSSPDWSPDGLYLAYVSRRGQSMVPVPGAATLVIRSLKSGKERDIRLNTLRSLGQVRWCAGGRSIVGVGMDQKKGGIRRVDAASGEVSGILTNSVPGPYLQQPQCSPDGKSIFYVARDLGWRIRARKRHRLHVLFSRRRADSSPLQSGGWSDK